MTLWRVVEHKTVWDAASREWWRDQVEIADGLTKAQADTYLERGMRKGLTRSAHPYEEETDEDQ